MPAIDDTILDLIATGRQATPAEVTAIIAHVAGFLAPSHVQQVLQPEQYIFVAYSPIHGTITTGYQAGDLSTVFHKGVTDAIQHT